jgi:hypothetical protein
VKECFVVISITGVSRSNTGRMITTMHLGNRKIISNKDVLGEYLESLTVINFPSRIIV